MRNKRGQSGTTAAIQATELTYDGVAIVAAGHHPTWHASPLCIIDERVEVTPLRNPPPKSFHFHHKCYCRSW
jgi:hypothetical protein